MEVTEVTDSELLQEIGRRFDEKQSSISEMEFMTKKLLKLNEKNKDAQEVKSKFMSLIKNEFNNPMSSLLNIVNMMMSKPDKVDMPELSSLMKFELLKLDFSLKNIFAASEIEAGEIANSYASVDIREIFDEVVEYFSYVIKEKSLTVEYINNSNEKFIVDPQKLEIILLNLVSNACEYSYENSNVRVMIECNEDEYIIKVEDEGEGVYEEHSKHIYNRFSHFETGKTRATAGLGLGLSVVRGMVEALDGSIDNATKDSRTVFCVHIKKVNEDDIDISMGIGSNEFMFDDNEMMEF